MVAWLLGWPRADPYRLNEVWQRCLAEACPEKRVSLKAGNEAVVGTGPRLPPLARSALYGSSMKKGPLLFSSESSISMDDDPWDGVEGKIPRPILISSSSFLFSSFHFPVDEFLNISHPFLRFLQSFVASHFVRNYSK